MSKTERQKLKKFLHDQFGVMKYDSIAHPFFQRFFNTINYRPSHTKRLRTKNQTINMIYVRGLMVDFEFHMEEEMLKIL